MKHTLALNLTWLLLALTALWLYSIRLRNVSIVDAFWGAGFALVAWVSTVLNSPAPPRVMLLTALTTLWGARLAIYLLWRNWGVGEDRRYAAIRARVGKSFWWSSLFSVFLLQGALLWFISLPLQAAASASDRSPFAALDYAGLALWALGMFFETIGDTQLARFRADPRNAGRVMNRGLWRYTRHPNYFGDFCVWWGLYLIAASGGAAWTIASPLLMTFLLLRVSGVSLLERTIQARRPEYAVYQRATNAFFPGPPRRFRRHSQ